MILRMILSEIDLDFGVMRTLTYQKYAPLRFSDPTILVSA
jgi:hypothetical protein